jgi:hypothetical protein
MYSILSFVEEAPEIILSKYKATTIIVINFTRN